MDGIRMPAGTMGNVVWFCDQCHDFYCMPDESLLPGTDGRPCDGCGNRLGRSHGRPSYWVYWKEQLFHWGLVRWGQAMQRFTHVQGADKE